MDFANSKRRSQTITKMATSNQVCSVSLWYTTVDVRTPHQTSIYCFTIAFSLVKTRCNSWRDNKFGQCKFGEWCRTCPKQCQNLLNAILIVLFESEPRDRVWRIFRPEIALRQIANGWCAHLGIKCLVHLISSQNERMFEVEGNFQLARMWEMIAITVEFFPKSIATSP